MDIDLLSKMVKELILDNDRVVLPGLGAFVAEIVPSTFSDKGYTINPPYRRLFFRSKPNEGKELAELYAKGNNVELAVAERIIGDFVDELKSILYTRKAVAFPGLGRLRATKENNVFFIADEDLDIYPAGFGLEPISLKTHQETPEEVSAAVEDLKSLLVNPPQEVVPQETVQQETVQPETVQQEIVQQEVVREEAVPQEKVQQETVVEQEIVKEQPQTPPEPTSEPISEKKPFNAPKALMITLGIIFALALLLLAALAIVVRTSPEWIDQYLYTPEELKILNHIL